MNIHKSRLFAESWNVAYRKRKEDTPFDQLDEPFIIIQNPFRYWAADPFLFEKEGETYIFAELYDYKLAKGVIGYLHLNSDNPKWIPVIEERYHLSFPYIYEKDNEIYILPEANESRTLYRYRAESFPDRWVKEDALITNIRFADTTPIREYDYNLALTYDLDDESLKLIDLAESKIKSLYLDEKGVRRPAGYISAETGMRAAQECLEDYGKGIILYHFELSADHSYHESEKRTVHPQDLSLNKRVYLDGMHTFNQSRHFEVIDIKTRRFNILNFVVRMYRKFRKNRSGV